MNQKLQQYRKLLPAMVLAFANEPFFEKILADLNNLINTIVYGVLLVQAQHAYLSRLFVFIYLDSYKPCICIYGRS